MTRFAILGVLALAACNATNGNGKPQIDAVTNAAVNATTDAMRDREKIFGDKVELTYFSSKSFDVDLSDAMSAKPSEITLAVPSPFPLSNLPPDLDKWLYAIKQEGGRVVAEALPPKDQVASRGFIALLIEVMIPFVTAALEPNVYAPARHYNAKLLYDKESGTVRTVRFLRRDPAT